MARRVIEHADFSGGEYGRMEAWIAPKNMWTGTNMVRYRTGELGVRAGIQQIPVDGLVAGSVGFLEIPLSSSRAVFGQGTAARSFNASDGSGLATAATPFAISSGSPSLQAPTYRVTGFLYTTLFTDKSYQINATGATPIVTALTGSPGGRSIGQLGDRLLVGSISGGVNSLRYNGLTAGVSDFNFWPATNLIPVGNINDEINGLYIQRTHLLIAKNEGFYVLTGNPGVNESLRQVSTTPGPSRQQRGHVDPLGRLGFAPVDYKSPAYFDGTAEEIFKYIPVNNPTTARTIRYLRDAMILTYTGVNVDTVNALLLVNGAWSVHDFEVPMPGSTSFMVADDAEPVTNNGEAVLVLCDGGGASTVPNFYWWVVDQSSPGIEGQSFQRAGDNSTAQVTGNVTFPEVHLQDADEFMVQGVIVDFRSWNTGGSLTNHFDVQVDCLRPYDNTSPITSLKGSWDQAGALSSPSGTIQRETFMFGEQGLGNGYQLKFTNVRGMAIQRIQVILETTKFRGV